MQQQQMQQAFLQSHLDFQMEGFQERLLKKMKCKEKKRRKKATKKRKAAAAGVDKNNDESSSSSKTYNDLNFINLLIIVIN